MPAYLISRTDCEPLETLVFHAGPEETEEAVAVFSEPSRARSYLEQAGLSDFTVASLEPIPFLQWLLQAQQEGVKFMAFDPDYERQQRGERQEVLELHAQLEQAALHILRLARHDF